MAHCLIPPVFSRTHRIESNRRSLVCLIHEHARLSGRGGRETPGVVHLTGTGARPRRGAHDRESSSGRLLGCTPELSPLPFVDDGTRENRELSVGFSLPEAIWVGNNYTAKELWSSSRVVGVKSVIESPAYELRRHAFHIDLSFSPMLHLVDTIAEGDYSPDLSKLENGRVDPVTFFQHYSTEK